MESILIADDHPLTREALASLLEQHGFDVVGHASDGAEAIVEAGRLRPNLVLLDLTMPGMDGLTALPHIREASPESEVVVLTASGTDDNLLEAIRAGAAGSASLFFFAESRMVRRPSRARSPVASSTAFVKAAAWAACRTR